jgi:Domain of unknown function(DUF2779)
MPVQGLSKSKIMSGLQCPKRLWLEIHHPELMVFSDRAQQAFEAGHEVGAVAQRLHPSGVLIGFEGELDAALAETRHMVLHAGNLALFEPAFRHDGVLVRADVLTRQGDGVHLVEVKSSTQAKPHYLDDIAILVWAINGAGQSVRTAELWHIDNSFIYPGNDDYDGLFKRVDVTAAIGARLGHVPGWVADCRRVVAGPQPDIAVGKQCTDPNECPFIGHCIQETAEYPVSLLPNGGKLVGTLSIEGYQDLRDVPGERLNSETHLRVWRVTRSGQAELDPQAALELRRLPYPRYYLDFETIQFAVPIWPGTRPYEQLPFQWSCHVEEKAGQLDHREFLDTTGAAPMHAFIKSLIAAVGTTGPILVYTSFERTVLTNLIERFPELRVPIGAAIDRLVDLHPIAKAYYYHPAMKGSWSIKAVLPTIAPDLAYENLGEVRDGGGAQDAYRVIIDPHASAEQRKVLEADLRMYCQHDTLAIVELARFLEGKYPRQPTQRTTT